MAYTRKDMLDEDKWNIHSSSYRQEKYGSGKGKDESEKYKHEQYGKKEEKEGYKASEDYRKKEDEEKKAEEENKEPSIEDAVKEKEQKKNIEEEQEVFKIAAEQVKHEFQQDNKKYAQKKGKNNKSIEDAVNKAIKEERETIVIDR